MRNWRREVETRLARVPLDPLQRASIVEEQGAHLEDRVESLVARGMPRAEAERTLAQELEEELLAAELRSTVAAGRGRPGAGRLRHSGGLSMPSGRTSATASVR